MVIIKVMPLPKKEKGSILIYGLLLALLILLVGVVVRTNGLSFNNQKLATPIPSPSPQPLVYQDNKTGFKVTYEPNGIIAIKDSEETFFEHSQADFQKNFSGYVGYLPPKFVGGVVLSDDNNHPEQFATNPLTIWVFDNENGLSIEKWYDRYWYYPFVWGQFSQPQKGQIAPDKESSISGQLAKGAVVSYRPGEPQFIYLAYKDKMFLFKVIDTDENKGSGSKILSGFRLID